MSNDNWRDMARRARPNQDRGGGGGQGRGGGGGQGRGGGGGQGRGDGRQYDDTKDFNTMQDSPEVVKFFRSLSLQRPFLSPLSFHQLVSAAQSTHRDSRDLRHQFLISLAQSSFFQMDGPISGTIMELAKNEEPVDCDISKALLILLDIIDEMLMRIPHVRNTIPDIISLLSLLTAVKEVMSSDILEKMDAVNDSLSDPGVLLLRIHDPTQNWSSDVSFIGEPILPDLHQLLNSSLDECFNNPVKGTFQSSAHYLETWFRLMREDFLGPLRDAIKDYQKSYNQTDLMEAKQILIDGGYHYSIKKVKEINVVQGEYFMLVRLDEEKLQHVDWESSDRLKFDSIMVLSDDHFQTGRFAMITNDDTKPALRGKEVWLKLLDGPMGADTFEAIEPMAFYEPYRCVLERLKILAAKVDDGAGLPMSRYLVEVNKTVNRPIYFYDDTQIVLPVQADKDGLTTSTEFVELDISALGLDHSQEKAMKLALSHELALIQGPPGTGKSYVGAMFVKIMMLNKDLWQRHGGGCMLILAYKNHAIDQFIEDCEHLGIDMKQTVRIGAGSNSAMEEYLLKNRRKELQNLSEYKDMAYRIRSKRRELKEVKEYVNRLHKVLKCENCDMDINVYVQFLPGFVRYQLWLRQPDADEKSNLFAWLNGGNEEDMTEMREAVDNCEVISNEQVESICEQYEDNIYDMPQVCRLQLYVYWCEIAREEVERLIVEWQKWHDKVSEEMKDLICDQDLAVVRRADIIAMTTTGASKHGHLIDAVRPTIILCEEAAEVLESHIVAPLTAGCRHIVLIGDHQQLRPSVNNFAMEQRNLSISLFERMIVNDLPSQRLQIQHRMHPEIADLLVPHIYDSLENHPVVHTYPKISGIKQRILFIGHEHLEHKLGEKSSYRNSYEADYLVYLAHYLLRQGYSPEKITILTTYTGQKALVKEKIQTLIKKHPEPAYTYNEKLEMLDKEFSVYLAMCHYVRIDDDYLDTMKYEKRRWYESCKEEYERRYKQLDEPRSKIEDIRVTTVDNYQGEECEIILLSFVRSNAECSIGFLKWANRICVGLSRAKHGFYAIGNFKSFAMNQKSDLWKKLCIQLRSGPETKLSDHLDIECPVHGTVQAITEAEQFVELAPEGGCTETCDYRLPKCGHACSRLCHSTDLSHADFVCKKVCRGQLTCGHSCLRRCDLPGDDESFFETNRARSTNSTHFRECLVCRKIIHCKETINIIPESCLHLGSTLCSARESYSCQRTVAFSLDCGHTQTDPCSTDKSRIKCRSIVDEELDCGHSIHRPCHADKPRCQRKVMQDLPCGHRQQVPCADMSETDTICAQEVEITLKCGHRRMVPCPDQAQETKCDELISAKMKCGHDTEIQCCESHQSRVMVLDKRSRVCEVLVDIALACGHKKKVRCMESTRRHECEIMVERTFQCGHRISEKCSTPRMGMNPCSIRMMEKYGMNRCSVRMMEKLECGHKLEGACWEFETLKREGCSHSVKMSRICGHEISVLCRNQKGRHIVSRCEETCTIKCSHGTLCNRPCSRPCPRCVRPCQNQCPHNTCSRRCYEECDREPCNEQCPKKLPCGHQCGGVCGELCPKTCLRCRPKKIRKGRRLRIQPCDHDFTVNEMDKHMTVRENAKVQEVVTKMCPMKHCKSIISYCPRYANQIKRFLQLRTLEGGNISSSSKSWWFCKPGNHYIKLDRDARMAVAAAHRCQDYSHLRVETTEVLTDIHNMDRELTKPDVRKMNQLFRNIEDEVDWTDLDFDRPIGGFGRLHLY